MLCILIKKTFNLEWHLIPVDDTVRNHLSYVKNTNRQNGMFKFENIYGHVIGQLRQIARLSSSFFFILYYYFYYSSPSPSLNSLLSSFSSSSFSTPTIPALPPSLHSPLSCSSSSSFFYSPPLLSLKSIARGFVSFQEFNLIPMIFFYFWRNIGQKLPEVFIFNRNEIFVSDFLINKTVPYFNTTI